MSMALNRSASTWRRLCRLAVVVSMVFSVGCAAVPGRLARLPIPFGKHSRDQALRKQVEADSFPTAQQAGL